MRYPKTLRLRANREAEKFLMHRFRWVKSIGTGRPARTFTEERNADR